VLGFTFGVVQMVLYTLYRNATPKEVANDVKEAASADGTFKVPGEHVVTIANLSVAPAVAELIEARDAQPDAALAPQHQEEAEAKLAENGMAAAPAQNVGCNADQVWIPRSEHAHICVSG
jgi:solute carrier family 50 protein (sugar transporter)